MMVYYTVVDEGYDVVIYRSAIAVARLLVSENAGHLARNEATADSENQIAGKLRENDLVYAYEANASDWKYKVKKHTRMKG